MPADTIDIVAMLERALVEAREEVTLRMARAIFDWQQSKLAPWDVSEWDKSPRTREALLEMAKAAYDAI